MIIVKAKNEKIKVSQVAKICEKNIQTNLHRGSAIFVSLQNKFFLGDLVQ